MTIGSSLDVETSQIEGGLRMALVGRMVSGEGEHNARKAFSATLASSPGRLLVDLQEVIAIDSSGVGELLILRGRCQELGIELRLLHLHSRVSRVLDIAKLSPLFRVFDDEQKALASFGSE